MQFYLVAPIILVGVARALSAGEGFERVKSHGSALCDNPSPRTPLPDDGARVAKYQQRLVTTATFIAGVAGLMAWSVWRLTHGATLETPQLDVFIWLFLIGIACELMDCRPSHRIAMISIGCLLLVVVLAFANPATRRLIWIRGSDSATDAGLGMPLFFVTTAFVALPLAIRTVHQPSSKWDRWLGDLSFPLYLFHWIPRDWYYANADWSQGSLRNSGLLLMNFSMAIVGAVFLLQFVDRPIQKLRQGWLKRRSRSVVSSTTAI